MRRLGTPIVVVLACRLTGCATEHLSEGVPVAETTAPGATAAASEHPASDGAATLGSVTASSDERSGVVFTTQRLAADFVAEGAAVGDLNADGVPDLVAGPLWYEGPNFTLSHELTDAPSYSIEAYSEFFLTFVDDVNGDGALDVVAVAAPNGMMGTGDPNTHWYENPGTDAVRQKWVKHLLYDAAVSNESPILADVTGDRAPELVFMTNQVLGFAQRTNVATDPWVFTPVSAALFGTPYVHGLGVGDVNGDGRHDIVEKSGWWEQTPAGQPWVRHAVDFNLGGRGGAQMLVFDVDGDGDADVVSSLNAHGYGLSWFEQTGLEVFVPHEILSDQEQADNFSQLHALVAADVNGDGLTDVLSGKRYFAHPSTNPDPGTTDPPVLYWFELNRAAAPVFVPHLIHADSGVGCSFAAADLDADGKMDVFTTNKRGTFVHLQL